MSRQTRVGVGVVGGSLVLGALGDWLFQGQALGLNAPLWLLAFVAVLAGLLALARAPLHQGRRAMVGPLVLFGALLAWHDSPLLVAANLLALAGALAVGALRRPDVRLRLTGVLDYAGGLLAAGVAAASGPFPVLERDIRWPELRRLAGDGRVASVARGAAIGAPLVLVFGGLFVAADAVFKQLVASAVPSLDGLPSRAAVALVFAWISMGLLRDLLTAREEDRVVSAAALARRTARPRVGAVELLVALGLVDLVFLAFVIVQLRYLFGIEIPHFKYEKLRDLARHLERVTGIPVQPTEPGIGLNVFTHESGIHTAGMLIHPAIYQFLPPADLGAKVGYVYGKHSGAVVIEHALREAGLRPEPELVAKVLGEVKRVREERAEQADFSEFHRRYYEHLNRLGLTAEEVVDIARALLADTA